MQGSILAAITLASVLFLLYVPFVRCLSISDRKQAERCVYSCGALDGFCISYTHSVNKGRIHDYYRCTDDGMLCVDKTVFVQYGAGIPEAYETIGASFQTSEEGYTITGLNRSIKRLLMAVGIVAEHSITIGERETYFTSLFAPQTSLVFEIKKVSVIDYIIKRRI